MTIVANMRLGTCRARFRRGLGASQACLGRVLAALWLLLGSFWTLLGVSWSPFASFLNTLGRIWAGLWCLLPGCCRAPMAVFAMVFGYAFCVLPLIVNNARVAAENLYWYFLGLSFSPLWHGATCAVRTLNTLDRIWALMGASASILEGLWCLWAGCWRAPVAIFAMVSGHAFRVSPRFLYNA